MTSTLSKTPEQFWESLSIDGSTGCWIARDVRSDGYAKTSWAGRTQYSHRAAWELVYGPVPEGLQVDHLCRNRACSNPAHLEPVTHAVNMSRAREARAPKSHCIQGHELTPENTYRRPSRPEARVCRVCKRQIKERYLSRKVR